ncbi:probably inactive leucine-rich repeat receptor-like protein kinase At5g48380 [Vitis riparia]|uniref:probably inactive leucine-rich repeat receptor-like protein kinase At5g48380 n=1 Tax=Vitis riparia TaxID=96939 RepID=UPI00155B0290|nr:probably inactive leucine-rich repeat receptor-like protein kinase At5g48380 [Vitis riparia]
MTKLMGRDKKTILLLLPPFLCCLLSTTSTSSSTDQDNLSCLRSIKSSVEDPFGSLNTWNFDNIGNGDICMLKGITCWSYYTTSVQSIKLQGLGLKGKFPQGIRNCTSLTTLDLSNNNFFGPIPANINQLNPYVTDLNLSYNKFSGEIPSSMASCVRLNHLVLNKNQLTGQIPPQLGQLYWIKDLNVANNRLSGPVPTFVSYSALPESYANNKGLCGGPLKACEEQGKAKDSFKSGFAVGWAVSAVSVTAVFMFVCMPGEHLIKMLVTRGTNKRREAHQVMLVTRRKMKKKEPHQMRILPIIKISMMEKFAARMPLTDLAAATNNFSAENIIGFGKTGTMYKAAVMNGCLPAVKRFLDSQQFEKQFIYEILILGRLNSSQLDTENKCLQCTLKKDVYSFGIVLLEMVTGKKPNEVSDASQRFDGTLVDWINHLLTTSGPYDAIDKSLIGQGFDFEIFEFLKVACSCVKASPHQRPTMLEVDKILRNTVGRHQTGDDSKPWTQNECGTSNDRDEYTGVEIMEECIEIVLVDNSFYDMWVPL